MIVLIPTDMQLVAAAQWSSSQVSEFQLSYFVFKLNLKVVFRKHNKTSRNTKNVFKATES